MTPLDWLILAAVVVLGGPILAYLVTKMIVYAKLDATRRYRQDHPNPPKGNSDDGRQERP